MPYLIIRSPGGRVDRAELDKSPTVLGRSDACDVPVSDSRTSRQHCQIVQHHGQWYLEDIESRNKTWMGREPVDNTLLTDGDEFRIGRTKITFRTQEGPVEIFPSP